MRAYIYALLTALYIINQFTPGMILDYYIGIVALIALGYSFFHAKGLYLVSGVIFFVSGVSLFIYNDLPYYSFLLHFNQMLGLLSLFIVLPFINSLIRIGHYDKNLSNLLQAKVTKLSTLYQRSFLVCHFLGLFLNIATIPLLFNSLTVSLRKLPQTTRNKFYTQNLLRAYALCLSWSPMEVMVSASVDITKSKYLQVLPIILLIVLISISLDWVITAFKYRNIDFTTDIQATVDFKKLSKKALQMLGMLLIFIVLVSVLQQTLNKGFLFSVILVLVPFSVLWAVLISRTKRYFRVSIPYWQERTMGLANYFFMFLSAGLFVEMLTASGFLAFLQPLFSEASQRPLLLYLAIAGFFLVTCLGGFHPLISLTFLAQLLQPIVPHVAPLPLTIVLIACSLGTVMYSPYNLSISILADQLKLNPYRMGLWNLGFAIFYMLFSIAIAYAIGAIF